MKIINLLNYILLTVGILLTGTNSLLGQTLLDKQKKTVIIKTSSNFKLTHFNSGQITNINIAVTYNSNDQNYDLIISNSKTSDDTTEPDIFSKTLTLKAPIVYQNLKDHLNKIVVEQFNVSNAITDHSVSQIYLWLYQIRNGDESAPYTGTLMLNDRALVFGLTDRLLLIYNEDSSTTESVYPDQLENNERTRAAFIEKKINNYSINKAKKDKAEKELNETIKVTGIKIKNFLTERINTIQNAVNNTRLDNDTININNQLDSLNEIILTPDSLTILKRDTLVLSNKYKNCITIKRLKKDSGNLQNFIRQDSVCDSLFTQLQRIKTLIEQDSLRKIKRNSLTNELNIYRQDVSTRDRCITTLKSLVNRVDSGHLTSLIDNKSILLEIHNCGVDTLNIHEQFKKIDAQKEQLNKAIKKLDYFNLKPIYPINKVSLQFERGFLERVQVSITIDGREEIFENNYAIGFSSPHNFKTLKDVKLYIRSTSKKRVFIYLSDVFTNYNNLLRNYTRDYSPADTSINNINPVKTKILPLKASRLVNLFDTKIYTDIRGLNEEEPNGLVQIEASRRLNIKTNRYTCDSIGNLYLNANFGIINHITIWGTLSKIEGANRELLLQNDYITQNNTLISPYYATNLDFRKYEQLAFGFDANIGLFDFPDEKVTFYANVIARVGITPLVKYGVNIDNNISSIDSVNRITLEASTFTLSPQLKAEVFSEKRIGLTLSWQFLYTNYFTNNNFKPIVSYQKSQTGETRTRSNAKLSYMAEMYVRIQTAENAGNKFFIRTRLFWQHADVNTSFSQVQLGYSYNLFYKK